MKRKGEMIGPSSLPPQTKGGVKKRLTTQEDRDKYMRRTKQTFRRTTQLALELQTLKFSHKFYNCFLIFLFKSNYKNDNYDNLHLIITIATL